MVSRYDNRYTAINSMKQYLPLFQRRGIKFIKQFRSPKMPYPNATQRDTLTETNHVWRMGDRYYKLASQYYGDPTLWWVIAWYNQLPTESHVSMGQTIIIPLPYDRIIPLLMQTG